MVRQLSPCINMINNRNRSLALKTLPTLVLLLLCAVASNSSAQSLRPKRSLTVGVAPGCESAPTRNLNGPRDNAEARRFAAAGQEAALIGDQTAARDAFAKAANFLINKCNEKQYAIIGYELEKTLSDHGSVSRGVCQVDAEQNLMGIKERTKIYRENDAIIYEDEDGKHTVPSDSSVSMNFWCFHPGLFTEAERLFLDFVAANNTNIKAEFFIPIIAEHFMENRGGHIRVIPCNSKWFGVTYKEDAPVVKANVDKLVADGVYPPSLWQ